MRAVIDERIKWRFVNPDEYAARVQRDPRRPASARRLEDAETVDGRAIEHSSSPGARLVAARWSAG